MSKTIMHSLAPRAKRSPPVALAMLAGAAGLAALAGCTVMPSGPTVMALPGTGKTFDQFRADDASCRQYAFQQVGGVSTQQAANNSAVGSAVVGTAVGAAAGAAFGGGQGAAIGAGAGLLGGSAIGAGNAQGSAYGIQRRYDYAYVQCMYAAGDRVPMPRGAVTYREQYQGPPQAAVPPNYVPPPPDTPPPPPPRGY
ncbi:YMGG-like glycine zipper-containing protein [Trinickia symbiotica]|uniref:YMGG-like glycine zipper-containing protein n=2 Tax=Trinickia symbiotica TaxID=863227 RepID=UPI000375BBB0